MPFLNALPTPRQQNERGKDDRRNGREPSAEALRAGDHEQVRESARNDPRQTPQRQRALFGRHCSPSGTKADRLFRAFHGLKLTMMFVRRLRLDFAPNPVVL
jgi:hypothetical protein